MSPYKLKGTSGSVINRSFPFADSILLGSADDCDVTIDEEGVLPRHAEIRMTTDNTLLLKDLGSGKGTLLNGEAITETALGSGDEIRIGTCRFMLQAPGLRPDRVLTSEAVQKPGVRWPRVLLWAGLTAAAAAVAILRWKPEWLDFL